MDRAARYMNKPPGGNAAFQSAAVEVHHAGNDIEGLIPLMRMRRRAGAFRRVVQVDLIAFGLVAVGQDGDLLTADALGFNRGGIRDDEISGHQVLLVGLLGASGGHRSAAAISTFDASGARQAAGERTVSRGWPSPLAGVGAALLALAVLVGV